MPAYAIVDVTTTDPALMDEYRKLVPATFEAYGGKFIVRGGAHQTIEGEWKPNRLVMIEFPSMDHAKRWYASPEYQEPLAMRLKAGRANFVLVEGV